MLVALWSPKGGSGTSVVSAALALVSAIRAETRLADLGGDQPAILSVPGPGSAPPPSATGLAAWLEAGPAASLAWLEAMAVPVLPGLSLLPRGDGPDTAVAAAGAALAVALGDGPATIVDGGTVVAPAARAVVEVAEVALLVIRPCYLALRRAVGDPRLERSAGVVLVEEAGRALDAADVAAVLGRPVVGRFPVRPEVARAVDAGVLRHRLPAALAGPASAVLAEVGGSRGGRWAA